MLGFVDPLANKTKYHLFAILFLLIEVIYSLECDSKFNFKVRQISFCPGQCSVNNAQKSGLRRALSLSEFDATCKQPKSITSVQHASQYYYSSKAAFGDQSGAKYRVFIFDFHLVSGNVYIDFKKLNLTPNNQPKDQTNVSLIISLVSHQFMTFRIFNLPSRRSVYINDIKILLNGAASLDLMEKKGDLEIQVHHSPLYHFSLDRKEWIHYLNTLFAMKIDGYVEYLSQFCHISHVRIDVNKMVLNLHNTSHFEDFVRPLEEMESLSENIDAEVAQYHLGKTCFLKVNESAFSKNFDKSELFFAINFQPHIFLDIGQNWDKNENYLKIFIKECDITQIYNLILFVNKQFDRGSSEQKLKKLIIDENYCHLRIYSNADVYTLLNAQHHYKKYDYNFSEINDRNESKVESKPEFRQEIFELLDKRQLKKFVYMKVIPNATEIELRFLTDKIFNHYSPDKFYNTINQQIILEKEVDKQGLPEVLSTNFSIKFAILESVVKEYFHSKDIDLNAYLRYNQIQTETRNIYDFLDEKNDEIEYFWISNKQCRVTILDSKIFPGVYPYLLFFNSNLYTSESNCYYFDQATHTFHMMLGFNFNHESYIKTIYFNMKKNIKENAEFNYLNKRLEAEREKAVRGYYNNIILKAIESNYKVVSKSKLIQASNGENNYDINSIIKFKSLDDAISWSPEFCWLSQLDCSNYVDSFFFSKNADHSDFYYYDEFDSPWKMEQEFDFGSNMVRHRRSFDYGFETQTKLVKHILINYSTKIQKVESVKKYFVHEIKLKLRLDKTPKHFKIVLCNLKPFASCNDSFKSNENNSKEKPQLNEACEETKLKQFFEQNSVDRKMKTVFLTKFDRNGNLIEFVDYDSNDRNTHRIQCSKLIPKNALNDAHLTSPTLSQETTSSLPQTQYFYQSVLLFFNLNKMTVILIFVSSIVSLFLIILVILICKKSNRANNSELNSRLSKRSIELKPLNRVKVEYENRENIEQKFKLLSAEKNGNLLNKKNRLKKKKKFDLKKNICEV